MDKTNSKILTVSFALAGALVGLTLSLLITAFAGVFGWMARLSSVDMFRHGIPVGIGFLVFLVLQLNPRILAWGDEVVSEIRKVVWPSGKDVRVMTIVVIVMVLISSMIIASFDFVSAYLINFLMR